MNKILFILVSLVSFITIYHLLLKQKTDLQTCKNCKIIFISIDTLKAKNTHFLGYKKKTTPHLDRFAEKSIIFENAFSVASWTLPSTMSWFTSMYPSQHKVLNKFTSPDDNKRMVTNLKYTSPKAQTLAEALKKQGYYTGGFTGGAGVEHHFGFDQGFDIYTDDKNFGGFKDSIPKALNWIKKHKNKKFFVFLHGYDVHGQYVPEEGYDYRFVDFSYRGKLTGSKEEQAGLREQGLNQGKVYLTDEDVRFLTALYDEKIQRADSLLGKFISDYSRLGLLEKTVIIITSDHGEEFYEHGRIDHGHSLYDEVTHVPLIMYVPSVKQGKRIKNQVRSIDLMPTILDLLEINKDRSIKKQMAGKSLAPFLKGENLHLNTFSESDYLYLFKLRSVRTWDNWKVITDLKNGLSELYNINKDEKERNNVAKKDGKFKDLKDLLENYLQALSYSSF